MSRLRAVLAGVVTTAVLVVMPGGWTAFADDQIPDAPGGVLNEEWSPPASADDGSQDVGQIPDEKWTLVEPAEEPAPEAAPTEEPAPEQSVTKAPAAKTAAPEAPVAPKSQATEDATTPEAESTQTPAPESTETPAESAEAPQEATVEPAPKESDAAASKSLAEQGTFAAPAQPEAQQLSATSAVYPAPGIGALPWFTFDQVNVTTDTLARVNLGNGNLLLTGNNGTLTGPGVGVRNDRFYNSLSTHEGALGTGWSSALSANDVGLQVTSTTATYRGPNGYEAVFTKNGSAWVAPAGFKAALTADGTGWKIVYDGSGEIIKFNSNGWITNYTDRNSVGATYNYTNGQLSGVTQASGRSYSVQYESWNTALVYRITDSAGRVTTYGHDTNSGQLKWVVPPGDVWEYYAYNGDGLLSQIKWRYQHGGEALVNFTYDSSRRVTKIEQTGTTDTAITGTTTYAYNAGQTLVTNGNGKTTTYEVDSSGRVLSATDPLGNKRSQTYNARNDIATSTDALGSGNTPGNQTAYSYDSLGNATGVTLPTGAAASATYALGNGCTNTGGTATQIKCSTDASGNGKRYDYDAAGNPTKTTDTTAGGTGAVEVEKSYASSGNGCWYTPAKNGQICSTADGNGNTTKYKYNNSGDLVRVEPPSPMGATVYTYDSLGRVLTVTDGNGDVTSYAYNQRDEIVQTTFDDSSKIYTKWYFNGLKERDSQSTDNTGPLEIWNYDTAGRAARVTTVSDIGQGLNTFIYDYTYDAAGNQLTYEDNIDGKITYSYDNANRLIGIADPDKTCSFTAAGSAAGSGCVKMAYNANGAETLRTFPGNATVATTRDNSGRATRITAKDGSGATKVDIGYTFTAPGGSGSSADRTNIQTRTAFLEEGITAGAVTTYAYDSLNRLKTATEKVGSNTNASWAYSYDNAGNRTQQVRAGNTGAAAGTINTTYNAANQITGATGSNGSWTYDAVGNQTRNALTGVSSTYNDRGAVTTIGSSTYTAWKQGNTNTLTRTNGSTTNGYKVSPTGQVMSGGTGASQKRAYTRTPDGDVTAVRYFTERYSFVKDSLGSVVGAFNSSGAWQGGYSYSPYGETRGAATTAFAVDNPLRYISGYYDTTVNLYRLGARYYDPSLGRFTQGDPSGQEKQSYAYAACNPVNAKDPSGLVTCEAAVLDYVGLNGLIALEAFGGAIGSPSIVAIPAAAAAIGFTTLQIPAGGQQILESCDTQTAGIVLGASFAMYR